MRGYPGRVTRIIAGAARGAALTVPRRGTRPTSDRVREALFSAVEARMRLRGARVLDLYAGSGALGLEALSRGAAAAVLVERDPAAARVLRGNARSVTARLPDGAEARIVASGVERFLDGCRERFEAVFADPPYELAEPELARVLERLADGRLAHGALVVVERSARSPEPAWPAGLNPLHSRAYGETAVHYARSAPPAAGPPEPGAPAVGEAPPA